MADATHRLAAFAIILDETSRVLLCHRTDRDAWNLPGGGVEAGETPWDAVIREVSEEVGLEVRVERLLGVYSVPAHPALVFSFRCERTGGALRLSNEADDIQWFHPDALPATTLPRHVERIRDAIEQGSEVPTKVQS